MNRKIISFKSDEYITGKLETKLKIAKEDYRITVDKIASASDADEQQKLLSVLYETQNKMQTIYNDALQLYVADIGTDTERLYDDVNYMLQQIDYELVVASYSTHVALNSLELSLKRIKKLEADIEGDFTYTATIDHITEENIDAIINDICAKNIDRQLYEQFAVIDRNYSGAEAQGIEEKISALTLEYIRGLIEAAGGTEALIQDLKAKIKTDADAINKTEPEYDFITQLDIVSKELIPMPSSPSLHIISSLLSNKNNLPAYVEKKNKANKNRALSLVDDADPIQVKQGDNEYKIVYVKGKETLSVSFTDIDKTIKSSRPASNIWTYILPLIEQQAYSNGELYAGYITFTLQDLVSIAMYGDIRAAREGYKSAADVLINLKAEAYDEKTGAFVLANIFTSFAKPANNVCTVGINHMINWKKLFRFHDQLPNYYFRLPDKAKDLLFNLVAYLARQNADQIRDKGYFTIGLRQAQAELNLPDEHNTKDVKGKIKTPIAEAIKAINDADGGRFYRLELQVDEKARPTQYLDTGKILVYPLNEVKEHILKVKDKQDKIIESKAKRIEKIKDKALEKAIIQGKKDEDILGGN